MKDFREINRNFEQGTSAHVESAKVIEQAEERQKNAWLEKYPQELLEPSLMIAQAHKKIKELEAQMQKAKDIILAYMQENGIKKMTTIDGTVSFNYIEEKETKRFDVKKAMEECPGLEVYYKTSVTKPYLKIN